MRTPGAAASGRNPDGTAPPRAPRTGLEGRACAPLRYPPAHFSSVRRAQDGLGKRVQRNVSAKILIEYRAEEERAPSLERHPVDGDANLETTAKRNRSRAGQP